MRCIRTRFLPIYIVTLAAGFPPAAIAGDVATTADVAIEQLRQKHVAKVGADRWHKAGYRGKGVKVAVLDTGFRGWRDHLGKALPAKVNARSFRSDGNLEYRESQHGILCGEVVHTI